MIAGVLFVSGIIFIIGSFLSLLGIPFYTRYDEWSKHSSIESFIMIRDGAFMIIFSLIYFKYIEPILSESKKKAKIKFSICPKCKETYTYKDLKDGKCPHCENIDTVDIEKYYKDKKEQEKEDQTYKDKILKDENDETNTN